jgi:hypothetical protein
MLFILRECLVEVVAEFVVVAPPNVAGGRHDFFQTIPEVRLIFDSVAYCNTPNRWISLVLNYFAVCNILESLSVRFSWAENVVPRICHDDGSIT